MWFEPEKAGFWELCDTHIRIYGYIQSYSLSLAPSLPLQTDESPSAISNPDRRLEPRRGY